MILNYTLLSMENNETITSVMDYEQDAKFLNVVQLKVLHAPHKHVLLVDDVPVYSEPNHGKSTAESCIINGLHCYAKKHKTNIRNALIDLWEESHIIQKRCNEFGNHMPEPMINRYHACLIKNLKEIDQLEKELLLY